MKIHAHPVTIVCRGQVEAVDRALYTLKIGATLWPMILPEDQHPRPEIGQHIQALTIPAGGKSPRVNALEPLTIIGWTKDRPPVSK